MNGMGLQCWLGVGIRMCRQEVAGLGYWWNYQLTFPSNPCKEHGSAGEKYLVPGPLPRLLSSKLA